MDLSGGTRISQRRGHQLSGGGGTYNFAKFSQKLHEIERIWAPGGRLSRPPLIRHWTLNIKIKRFILKLLQLDQV